MRLHISPFTEELLPVLLGPSLQSFTSNISFHTISAFPERPYGFVELPEMEAGKLKRKLNGSIIKGNKVKVEEARKDKRKEMASTDNGGISNDESTRKLRKSERKRGREDNVISGYQLPEDRKVKRGWTEAPTPIASKSSNKGKKSSRDSTGQKGKTKTKPSSFRDDPECLFKTQLLSGRSAKEGGAPQKKNGVKGEAMIHEFENTLRHPSFIRENKASQNKKLVQQYNEKMGWIDEDGGVIEPAKGTRQRSEATAGENTSSDVATDFAVPAGGRRRKKSKQHNYKTSLSDARLTPEQKPPEIEHNKLSSSPGDLPALQVTQSSPIDAQPHPLETLFKKPERPANGSTVSNKPALEVKVPFSFFGNDAEDEQIEKSMETPGLPRVKRAKASGLPNLSIPATPYTQRDMQWRSQRSAAPTPDTAAPGKSGFGDVWNRLHGDREDDIEEEDEDDDDGEDNEEAGGGLDNQQSLDHAQPEPTEKPEKQESEFAKWFWEHRGENNRAWKRRRREAAKEQRQRENKRRKKTV